VAVVVHPPLGHESPRYTYLSGAALHDDRFHSVLGMSRQDVALYSRTCLAHVAAVLRTAADRAGLLVTNLDWIMPDLSSAMFWRYFCRETGVARDRVCLDLLPVRGHNNGVDALSALQHADLTGRLRHGDRCALVAFGPGAYFQVVVVEVAGE
jgi:3-oxoacyl-[acyl-carrier-protein] synthase III